MGLKHIDCAADDIVIDEEFKVVSTPANMLAQNILQLYAGIHKCVKAVVKLCCNAKEV